MGIVKGGALRLFQTFLYFLAFICAGIILGIYSYFLSVLADRNHNISNHTEAVEGLSGVAVLYTILACLLTCCLGGITVFGILGLILDVCFCGAMIALAVLTDNGASSCTGHVNTPIGSGQASSHYGFQSDVVYKISLHHACQLNTACFAVAIIGAFIFLVTALMQIALIKNHKKEKRFGPGPNNNYTSGSGSAGRKMWWGKNRNSNTRDMTAADSEMGTAQNQNGGLAAPPVDTRQSHETGYTGTTVGGTGALPPQDKYESGYTNAGYHTQPTGTAVNPYGYSSNNAGTNY